MTNGWIQFTVIHSEVVEGNKEFLKNQCFTLKMGMLCAFLEV